MLFRFQFGNKSAFGRAYRRTIGLIRQRRFWTEPPLPSCLRTGFKWAVVMIAASSYGAISRGSVTFHRDVLPILAKNCQGCHSPGRIAPMPFTTDEETRPWAAAIRSVVVNKNMPPWITESHQGLFGTDGRLGQADVDTIVRWVDSGAPEGKEQNANKQKRKN